MIDVRKFLPNLLRWENAVPHFYRDNADDGNITIGIGCMIPSLAAASNLPLTCQGQPASQHDIQADWSRVLRLPPGMVAHAYRAPTSCLMADSDIEALALRRLETEFLPGLRRLCPGFDGFPWPAQSALVDMIYNMGAGAPATAAHRATGLCGFPTLLRYANSGRWADAAIECHRSTARPERNDWTRAQFLAVAGT